MEEERLWKLRTAVGGIVYEKHLASLNKSTVAALQSAEEDAQHVHAFFVQKDSATSQAAAEHAETQSDGMFAFIGGTQTEINFEHKTQWDAFSVPDSDHEDLVDAFKELTQHVQVGRRSQGERKMSTKPALSNTKKLTKDQINAIADKLQQGQISLPELDLPTDDVWMSIWSLVGSGSSVHVVDAPKIFLAPPSSHFRRGTKVSGSPMEALSPQRLRDDQSQDAGG